VHLGCGLQDRSIYFLRVGLNVFWFVVRVRVYDAICSMVFSYAKEGSGIWFSAWLLVAHN
jgi:hypothetical protein